MLEGQIPTKGALLHLQVPCIIGLWIMMLADRVPALPNWQKAFSKLNCLSWVYVSEPPFFTLHCTSVPMTLLSPLSPTTPFLVIVLLNIFHMHRAFIIWQQILDINFLLAFINDHPPMNLVIVKLLLKFSYRFLIWIRINQTLYKSHHQISV